MTQKISGTIKWRGMIRWRCFCGVPDQIEERIEPAAVIVTDLTGRGSNVTSHQTGIAKLRDICNVSGM